MMSKAEQGVAGTIRPVRSVAALGKLLAVVILLTPLVVMLFPELKQRSRTQPHGERGVVRRGSPATEQELIPSPFMKRDE
jgi:hypothetical protein